MYTSDDVTINLPIIPNIEQYLNPFINQELTNQSKVGKQNENHKTNSVIQDIKHTQKQIRQNQEELRSLSGLHNKYGLFTKNLKTQSKLEMEYLELLEKQVKISEKRMLKAIKLRGLAEKEFKSVLKNKGVQVNRLATLQRELEECCNLDDVFLSVKKKV